MNDFDLTPWPMFRSVMAEKTKTWTQHGRNKKCFVISPIGDKDSDIRRHADAVMQYIIRPALIDTEFYPHRADHNSAPGRISQQMFDAILDDDLIIAILTDRNPNVFYELAVAQSAARPVILLIERGQPIPFDVKDDRVIEYSLDSHELMEASAVRTLHDAVRHLADTPPDTSPPFRPGATPLNASARGAVVHQRSSDVSYSTRLEFLQEADTRVDIMGIANMAFALHPDVMEAARKRTKPLAIRVMQMAPDNPSLPCLLGDRDKSYLSKVQEEIRAAADAWQRVVGEAAENIRLEIRQLVNLAPTAAGLITDKKAVWTPYMASRTTNESPSLEAESGSEHYRVFAREFEYLWEKAAPHTAGRETHPSDAVLASLNPSPPGG
jgi:hypothetical protein